MTSESIPKPAKLRGAGKRTMTSIKHSVGALSRLKLL